MALDLDLAPFLPKLASIIDQKSAAHDPHKLAAIQRLLVDDVEFLAKRLISIGEQFKRKLLFRLELLVRGKVVAGNAKDYRVLANKFRIMIAKILPFSCAARRAVLGVKVKNDNFAPQRLHMDGLIAGCRALEVRNYTVEHGSGHVILLVVVIISGLDGFQDRIEVFMIAELHKLIPQLGKIHRSRDIDIHLN